MNSVVFAVGNVQSALRINCKVVRSMELTRGVAKLSPLEEELTLRRKIYDTTIYVAVAHIHGTIETEFDVCRLGKVTLIGAFDPRLPKEHLEIAVV